MKKRAITAILAAVCIAVTAACGADAEIPAAGDKVVAQDAQESSTESFMGSGDLSGESPDASTDPAGIDADNGTLIADAAKEAADEAAGKEAEQKAEDAAASTEADRVAGEQADAQAKAEAARKAEEEAAKKAQEEAAAKAEAEAKAQEAAAAKAEAEAKAKAEAEAAARAEAEAKAQQEAAAKAEAERIAREQAEAQRRAEEEAHRQQEEAAKNAQGGSSNSSADVVDNNKPDVEPEPTPGPTPAPTPEPTPIPHEHSWMPVYETRTVVVKEAWTEPAWEEVTQWETVDICEVKYTCAGCGWSAQSNEANGDYSAYEAAGRHQMEGASSTTGTNPCGTITSEDVVVGQETVPLVVTQHPEKYHPAETTTEQVIIGYTCSCGATK